MAKKPRLSEAPADTVERAAHRSKFEVTLDRLASMSPAQLRELGTRIAEHEAGDYMWKLLDAGFHAKRQQNLPGVE